MAKYGIGQPVSRFEDPRLLRGRGRYQDDVNLPGQAYAVVLRSPHAHARICALDTAAGAARAGGARRLHRRRSRAAGLGTMGVPFAAQAAGRLADVRPAASGPGARPGALCRRAGRVRRRRNPGAGEGRRRAGRGRLRAPALGHRHRRRGRARRAAVWDECPDNISNLFEAGNKAATDAAFASAAHIVRRRYVISRVYAHFMEPRGAIGVLGPGRGALHPLRRLQYPHRVRQALATRIFKIPESQIRVIAGDVGGGFGTKGWQYPEHRLVLLAAKKLRPAGQMDLRAQRGDPGRRARPRQYQRGRTGARRRGPVSRPAGAHVRRPRRLHLVRAQPVGDVRQCPRLDRRLRDPGGACRGPRRLWPTRTAPRPIAAPAGPRRPMSSSA